MKVPDLYVGKKLEVGSQKAELFGRGSKEIRQSVYLDGPCLVGNPENFPNVEGTLMVGPMTNLDSSKPEVRSGETFLSEWSVSPCGYSGEGSIKGADLYNSYTAVIRSPIGSNHETASVAGPGGYTDNKVPIRSKALSAAFFDGDVDIKGHVRIDDPQRNGSLTVESNASFAQDVIVKQAIATGQNVMCGADVIANGDVLSQCGAHILSAKKNFDIPHPSKDGWRLRHTCPEGPSNDVYHRGRVRNQNHIDLPEYWKDFVYKDSITVNLTPVGAHQDVIVKRIDESKIYLQSKGGMPIDCFFHIFGERTDGERLIPEYKGESPEDYPGNNDEYSVSGYHYDTKEEK